MTFEPKLKITQARLYAPEQPQPQRVPALRGEDRVACLARRALEQQRMRHRLLPEDSQSARARDDEVELLPLAAGLITHKGAGERRPAGSSRR